MDAQSGCYEFESLPIFREPLCLIDEDINIVPEVLKQVKTIDCPLVVVAVTGLYRTGKSYLMNRLAGLKRGFQLGHTVEPETKGIWALCKINPTKRDHVLMFLDTEGLCYVGKEDSSHDNKIFVLSTLLSNVLLYNIYSCFNSDAIEKTTFITELSKNIKFQNTKEEDSSDKLHTIMPTFVLCLRDFCLCLEKDGVEISADEYLEACLEINCKHGVYDRDSDWARKCIKKYFPQRKCFTFDRPADRMNINRLEDTYEANLSEEFREDIDRLRKYIYNLTPVASANSIPVTGTVFSHLVRTYTQAIREGKIPDVDDAFTVAKKFENERKRQNAILEFQSQISQIKLPILDKIELESSFEKIQKSVVTTFRPQFTLAAYGIKAELLQAHHSL
ncbi:guanylate-binding protein 1-like [Mercenaria mercenaria]|uniref:guanylate-binding protein 1-like n=1 Tax=Mercenaria mercenaria TaxID=6596 RepID=UPI00234F504E|nr:guanylate-binding protein 1-like [Mercenaria mercenaria]